MCDPITTAVAIGSKVHDDTKRAENEANREMKAAADAQAKALEEANRPDVTVLDPVADPSVKAKKLQALRAGMLSTIKTSPMGTPATAALKNKLGQ